MQDDDKYISLHRAIDNCSDNQAIVDLGIDRGYKLIDEEEW